MRNGNHELRIQFFGRFRLWRDDVLIPEPSWQADKSRAILKLLIAERGKIYSHDKLIEYLFPNLDPRKAAVNLRVRICELRRMLEPDICSKERSHFILTVHNGYCFNPEGNCQVDVEEFAQSYKAGLACFESGRYDQALHHFEGANLLYHGDFLTEDSYEDWVIPLQEHWREVYLAVLSHLSECLAHDGHYDQAIIACRKALCLEEYREDIYRQLMRLHSLAGNTGQALHVYEKYREKLLKNYGLEPSDITQKLYQQIRSQGASRAADLPTLPQRKNHSRNGLAVRPLEPDEIKDLQQWKAGTSRPLWQRAQIILLSAQGKSVAEVAQFVKLSLRRTSDWIRKFNQRGLRSLQLRKSTGRPSRITQTQREQIRKVYLSSPAVYGIQHHRWTQSLLTNAVKQLGIVDQISRWSVRLIVRDIHN